MSRGGNGADEDRKKVEEREERRDKNKINK